MSEVNSDPPEVTSNPAAHPHGLLQRLWKVVRPGSNSGSLTGSPNDGVDSAQERSRSNGAWITLEELERTPNSELEATFCSDRKPRGLLGRLWRIMNRERFRAKEDAQRKALFLLLVRANPEKYGCTKKEAADEETGEYSSCDREENSSAPAKLFSRSCIICCADSPRRRSVFAACGHAVCRACSLQMKMDAAEEKRALKCPYCRKKGTYARLDEEVIEETRGLENAATDRTEESIALDNAKMECAQAEERFVVALAEFKKALEAVTEARIANEAAHETTMTAANALEIAEELNESAVDELETQYALEKAREKVTKAQYHLAYVTCDSACENMEAADHARKLKKICKERMKNAKSAACGLRFSRKCRACDTESPVERAFFPACGHAVCSECAELQITHAFETNEELKCPECNNEGNFVPLYEELIEDNEVEHAI